MKPGRLPEGNGPVIDFGPAKALRAALAAPGDGHPMEGPPPMAHSSVPSGVPAAPPVIVMMPSIAPYVAPPEPEPEPAPPMPAPAIVVPAIRPAVQSVQRSPNTLLIENLESKVSGGTATSARAARKPRKRDRRKWATRDYEAVHRWGETQLVRCPRGMRSADLYQAYCAWCAASGNELRAPFAALSMWAWGRELDRAGFPSLSRRAGRCRTLRLR
jgi:hypothetical protein